MRRLFVLTLLAAAIPAAPVAAHHGWGWATEEEVQLTGTVKQVRFGNPHGRMVLTTAQGDWVVEIGQP